MSNPLSNPLCHDREACVQEPKPNEWSKRHEGYRHAASWEEVQKAIADDDVFDVDGDIPLALTVQRGGVEVRYKIAYESAQNAASGEYDMNEGEHGYILVPDFEPVTSDEEAAAIASILGAS